MNNQFDTMSESNESLSRQDSTPPDWEIIPLIGYIFASRKSFFERLDKYTDRYPFLETRKAVRRSLRALKELARLVIHSSVFEGFIIVVILLNSVALAIQNEDAVWDEIDMGFLWVYTAESCLKIIGMGFLFSKKAYLRDRWNILDFTIVITGWVEILLQEGVNLSALRVLRVLRPLRSISSIEGMKIIFRVLLSSIRPLLSTISILLFFLLIFAVAGLQIWMGVLQHRCVYVNTGLNGGDELICGNVGCPPTSECTYVMDNPNLGFTSYDNIFMSMITVFQFITLEGWRDIMVFYEKASSTYVFIYFVPLVFIGALFLINLALAVIKLKLSDTILAQSEKKQKRNKRLKTDMYFINKMKQTHMLSPTEEDCVQVQTQYIYSNDRKLLMMGIAKVTSGVSAFPVDRFMSLSSGLEDDNDNSVKSENELNINQMCLKPQNLAVLCHSKKSQFHLIHSKKEPCFRLNQKYVLDTNSAEDVIPVKTTENITVYPVYTFECVRSPSYEYPDSQMLAKEFNRLIIREHALEAYEQAAGSGRKQVKRAKKADKESNYVPGVWSGDDVFIVCEHSEFELCQLNVLYLYSKGWKRYLEISRSAVHAVIDHKYFNYAISLCVFLNTIVLAMDHHGISQEMSSALNYINLVFTTIFVVEMAGKIIGLGFKTYVRDLMNCFDGLVVALSIIDIFLLEDEGSAISAFRAVRVFRAFRVLRIARLFRYLEYMSKLLRVVGTTIGISLYLALILLLFTIIFALVGMQLFGGQFDFPEGRPRAHFDDFHWAFITMFQVLSLENWNTVLYDGMRSQGPASALFFIIWILIGNFVLLNLFLAVLLDSFGKESMQEHPEISLSHLRSDLQSMGDVDRQIKKLMEEFRSEESVDEEEPIDPGPPRSWLRERCGRIVKSPYFEYTVLILILLSSLKLVLDTYWIDLPEDATEVRASNIADIAFTSFFTLELLLKTVHLGFFFSPEAYIRDHWNQLDFVIVVVSWLDLILTSNSIQALKVVRLLRTIRPLRFISHNLSMRVVINALIESSAAIFNVGIVIVIVWLIFAILGVSFFGGKFYTCSEPAITSEEVCKSYGYSWVNANTNFDNVFQALMTLFVISSLEGWPNVMLLGVDATEVGQAPEKDHNPLAAYFFVVFVIIGAFFFINLFIGVIFEKFQESKNQTFSTSFLTNKQSLWVEIQKLIHTSKPQLDLNSVPRRGLRKFCHYIATSTALEIFISNCIVLNMLQMALIYEGAPSDYVDSLEYINLGLTVVFAVEALVKLIGLGISGYFYDNWNRFDFIVVFASLIEIAINYGAGANVSYLRTGPQLVRAFRIVRVGRLIRLVKFLKDIQVIMETIKYSIPSILNILSLLLLIFFIYSVLGVFLFHDVKTGAVIDDYNNFWDFLRAMITLLRVSTGEDWYSIMYDCREQAPVAAYLYFSSFNIISSFIILNMFVMVTVQALTDHYDNPESPIDVFNRAVKQFKEVWAKYSTLYRGVKMHSKLLHEMLRDLGPPLIPVEGGSTFEFAKIITALNVPVDNNGYVYYHELLFCVLKRNFGHFRFNKNEALTKKIISLEERRTLLQINKVTEKFKHKKAVYFDSRNKFITDGNCLNTFSSYFTLKKVLSSWKKWTAQRKRERLDASDDTYKECKNPHDWDIISFR